MQDFLSATQRSTFKSAHKIKRDGKIDDRMKVVWLADQSESFAEIAKFLFIDEQTARKHLRDYFDNDKTGGSSGGSEGKLTQEQASPLHAILATCDVPNAQTAVEKAKGLFSIKFSVSGMTDWLNSNRFSFKKASLHPPKLTRWLKPCSLIHTAAAKTTCPRAKSSFSWMPHTPPWLTNWATVGRSKAREKSLRQRLEKNAST